MSPIRERAFAYLERVVPSLDGDDLFREVTQDRQCPGYSACADLGHGLLEALDVRDPKLVNRTTATEKWRSEANISKLRSGGIAARVWVTPAPFVTPQLGDIVLIGRYSAKESEHILVFRELEESNPGGTWWRSYDYGQFDEERGLASSTICARKRVGGRLDGREIIGWIDLDLLSRNYGLA